MTGRGAAATLERTRRMAEQTHAIPGPIALVTQGMRKMSADWLAYLAAAVSAVVLIVFIVYPISKTLLLAFIEPGKTLDSLAR